MKTNTIIHKGPTYHILNRETPANNFNSFILIIFFFTSNKK